MVKETLTLRKLDVALYLDLGFFPVFPFFLSSLPFLSFLSFLFFLFFLPLLLYYLKISRNHNSTIHIAR